MLHDWVTEARPKTLLLSFSNCALGCALGYYYGLVTAYSLFTGLMVILTGVLLQILCNFANDYGDAFHHADSDERLGPIRAVMSGEISLTQLRKAMAWVTIMSAGCGFVMLALAVGNNLQVLSWFVFLGVLSILAALFYTVGMAYGYKGFGDLAVFIFFGPVAIIGSQVLVTSSCDSGMDIYPDTLILGFCVGAASVMLLHVSSMRDIKEDRAHGKRTLASRMGYKLSAVYLGALFVFTAGSSLAACIMSHQTWEAVIPLLSLIPLMTATIRAIRHASDGARVALERKFIAIAVSLHNLAWIVVLIVDFWVYY